MSCNQIKRKLFSILTIIFLVVSTFSVGTIVQADMDFSEIPPAPTECEAIYDYGISSLQDIINSSGCVIQSAVKVVVPLALLVFLWGLAKFILVAGDEKEKERGKNIMVWGVIALFVMVSIWGLVNLLQSNFGIESITF